MGALLLLTAAGALVAGVPGALGGYVLGLVVSRWLPAGHTSCDVPAPGGDEPPPAA